MMRILLFLAVLGAVVSCKESAETAKKEEVPKMEITLESTAFEHGGMIPSKYTCDGEDISPPLAWSTVPEGTKSLALICDDPDAPMGTWVHWVIYDIPPDTTSFSEGIPTDRRLEDSRACQGKNDFRKFGYGGPCPPGGTHRYYFRLYALDTLLELEPGATKKDLLKRMEGHVLGRGELMGTYKR